MGNAFTQALTKHDARTWNQAISNSTSGDTIVDYFAKCGSYRGRTIEEVSQSMANIFANDPELALKVMFYNRLITRKIKGLVDTDTVQRGQGQKDEFIKSLAWLENNQPDLLYKNLWMIPVIGTWHDLWYDSPASKFYYYVDPKIVYQLVKRGLGDEYNRGLIAKFLPKIRSRRNIKNDRHRRLNEWARGLCRYLGWSEKEYRQFKSSPDNLAHQWQRYACKGEWNAIDFNAIPGKALFKLITHRGKDGKTSIERHGLEQKFLKWIKEQGIAKFTGYPYELYNAAKGSRNLVQTYTYDAQFEGLIELAQQNVKPEVLKRGVFCALDTSGSMSASYGMGPANIAPIDVCVGLGIYFSSLLQGAFKDHVIMFNNESRILKLKGTFCQKVDQIARQSIAWGGTNFQSVIDEIVRVRQQNPQIPVEDYPEILLCVSDMQYNCTGTIETNYEMLMRKLASVGLPPITCVWWQVNGIFTEDVPSTIDDPGTVLISGMDGAIVTAILGGQEEVIDKQTGEKRKLNPYEQMIKALDQEILNRVQV